MCLFLIYGIYGLIRNSQLNSTKAFPRETKRGKHNFKSKKPSNVLKQKTIWVGNEKKKLFASEILIF